MSARNIVLTENDWRKQVEQLKLSSRTISLISGAIRAWSARKNVRGYPQTSDEEFENLKTYDVDMICMSMIDGTNKTFRLELRLDGNHRHLVIRRMFYRKKK